MSSNGFHIVVLPGDGIGHEVVPAAIEVVTRACSAVGAPPLELENLNAGAEVYRDTGVALPEKVLNRAKQADAILLGAMGDPSIRYPDGTEIAPQLDLRFAMGLYAGVRPVRAIPGVPIPLADPRAKSMDFVIIRESTEGLFASHGKGEIIDDREARDTMVITRKVCERLFDFTMQLARDRKAKGSTGVATCVDKANVFSSLAFFRKIFTERGQLADDVEKRFAYVDAMALDMVRKPWELDVLVTENMFGDILSDLGAALMGGMGMAPSADIGDSNAVFQPCHGSAPDIAGEGKANPTATILSAAMMLEWLSVRENEPAAAQAAALVRESVDAAFATGTLQTFELGGQSGTRQITDMICEQIPHMIKQQA